ncbi:JmjC domain-containing protein 8 [Varanus komodoensis]|nr:JmjC domain-containing protein 8 [Varanus komodoensis]
MWVFHQSRWSHLGPLRGSKGLPLHQGFWPPGARPGLRLLACASVALGHCGELPSQPVVSACCHQNARQGEHQQRRWLAEVSVSLCLPERRLCQTLQQMGPRCQCFLLWSMLFLLPRNLALLETDGGWLTQRHPALPEGDSCTVERRDASLTYSQFLQRYAFSRPVILRGITDNSEFQAQCTKRKLLAAFGDRQVRLSTANTYSYRKVDLPFQEYVDQFLEPQDPDSLGSGEWGRQCPERLRPSMKCRTYSRQKAHFFISESRNARLQWQLKAQTPWSLEGPFLTFGVRANGTRAGSHQTLCGQEGGGLGRGHVAIWESRGGAGSGPKPTSFTHWLRAAPHVIRNRGRLLFVAQPVKRGLLGSGRTDCFAFLPSETLYFFGNNNFTEWGPLFQRYTPPPFRIPGMTVAYSFGIAGE